MKLKELGIKDGDSIKLRGVPETDEQNPLKEQETEKNEDQLIIEEDNHDSLIVQAEQKTQNYFESEKSEQIWKEIMQLYHMGEGIQGIFNGCGNINNCKQKLKEL